MVEHFEEDSVAFIVMAAWAIRTNRNEIRHGGKKKSRLELIHWCGHYLDEYHAAQVVPTKPSRKVEVNWSPPSAPFYKINVDGLLFQTIRKLGWVLLSEMWKEE